ncbi:Stf0 family sulfotransferase [Pelagibacterium lacus]|uniref:Stf0 family sulfotransferase n=1 Tax=Pelagibacterium lacus TaxID=2282655 RepID=UPI00131422F2|nr:Stf0 family sulfotransferase [Pelagibacterium lacus]
MDNVVNMINKFNDQFIELGIRARGIISSRLHHDVRAIPSTDFIDAQFDVSSPSPPRRFLAIISTPRSGSTLICDILQQMKLGIPHEYFQHAQYAKVCAARWNVPIHFISRLPKNWQQYGNELINHRTTENGIFSLNAHATHLHSFLSSNLWKNNNFEYIIIIRRDIISQAISYAIATQEMSWSSQYTPRTIAKYSFFYILRKARELARQYEMILRFSNSITYKVMVYEDFAGDPSDSVSTTLGISFSNVSTPKLQKQVSSYKEDFSTRFWEDADRYDYVDTINSLLERHVQIERSLKTTALRREQ